MATDGVIMPDDNNILLYCFGAVRDGDMDAYIQYDDNDNIIN